jgi:hypothetical protein
MEHNDHQNTDKSTKKRRRSNVTITTYASMAKHTSASPEQPTADQYMAFQQESQCQGGIKDDNDENAAPMQGMQAHRALGVIFVG